MYLHRYEGKYIHVGIHKLLHVKFIQDICIINIEVLNNHFLVLLL